MNSGSLTLFAAETDASKVGRVQVVREAGLVWNDLISQAALMQHPLPISEQFNESCTSVKTERSIHEGT